MSKVKLPRSLPSVSGIDLCYDSLQCPLHFGGSQAGRREIVLELRSARVTLFGVLILIAIMARGCGRFRRWLGGGVNGVCKQG